MKKMYFTSDELIYLAELCEKDQVYGIPNSFLSGEEGKIADARQLALEGLMSNGYVTMDFNGKIQVEDDIRDVVSAYSESDSYILGTRQNPTTDNIAIQIWAKNGRYLCAVVHLPDYEMSFLNEVEAKTYLLQCFSWEFPNCDNGTVTIQQRLLKRAKRYQENNDVSSAKDLLMQNGVDKRMAEPIASTLLGNTNIFSCVLVKSFGDEHSTKCLLFTAGDFGYVEMNAYTENLRSVVEFTSALDKDLQNKIEDIVSTFFSPYEVPNE